MTHYALLGHPLTHSLSPAIYRLFNEQIKDINSFTYQALPCTAQNFQAKLSAFFASGGKGCNITQPLKELAYRHADSASSFAKQAGSANLLIQRENGLLHAENTDGLGFLTDLSTQYPNFTIKDKHVLILGAGGAARGLIGPLLNQKPASLWISNRTLSRALTLAQHFNREIRVLDTETSLQAPSDWALIVNATSAHFSQKIPELPCHSLSSQTICYDLNYQKEPGLFLKHTQKLGARYNSDGFGMLIEQAAYAFYLWTGKQIKTAPILQQRQLLL